MIRTSSLFYALGVATIALALLVCLLSLLCILYVLYFRLKTHQHHFFALRDLNSLWTIRIMLAMSAGLCSLAELLRLPLLRYRGWLLSSMRDQTQENLCKGYLVVSQGFMEPFFYLTALFLVHGSLQNDPFSPRKKGNGRAVLNILVCCLPVFLLQLFFVIIGPDMKFRDGQGLWKLLPRHFTRTFEEVHYEGSREMALCTYPLLSTIVLGSFGIMYVSYFLYVCWRMLSLVINKRMQCRVYGLVFAVVLFLPVKVVFLGLTIFRRPGDDSFELLSFMGFVMSVLTATLGQGILVIRPISDALAVRWVFNSKARFENDRQSFGSGSIEVFSISPVGRDGEESLLGK
uniref:Uncharacterized protein n=1 Tax=Picea sitchensis TaxID=3332 RepID=D5AE46_PICSI|nr:unknown [Picea sitchensis]